MAVVMINDNPSFYSNYSKKWFFNSANAFENYIEGEEYYIACQNDKMYPSVDITLY